MKASSAAVKTLPVGFIGVLNRIALVLGPKAAASSARGSSQFGGDRLEGTECQKREGAVGADRRSAIRQRCRARHQATLRVVLKKEAVLSDETTSRNADKLKGSGVIGHPACCCIELLCVVHLQRNLNGGTRNNLHSGPSHNERGSTNDHGGLRLCEGRRVPGAANLDGNAAHRASGNIRRSLHCNGNCSGATGWNLDRCCAQRSRPVASTVRY